MTDHERATFSELPPLKPDDVYSLHMADLDDLLGKQYELFDTEPEDIVEQRLDLVGDRIDFLATLSSITDMGELESQIQTREQQLTENIGNDGQHIDPSLPGRLGVELHILRAQQGLLDPKAYQANLAGEITTNASRLPDAVITALHDAGWRTQPEFIQSIQEGDISPALLEALTQAGWIGAEQHARLEADNQQLKEGAQAAEARAIEAESSVKALEAQLAETQAQLAEANQQITTLRQQAEAYTPPEITEPELAGLFSPNTTPEEIRETAKALVIRAQRRGERTLLAAAQRDTTTQMAYLTHIQTLTQAIPHLEVRFANHPQFSQADGLQRLHEELGITPEEQPALPFSPAVAYAIKRVVPGISSYQDKPELTQLFTAAANICMQEDTPENQARIQEIQAKLVRFFGIRFPTRADFLPNSS